MLELQETRLCITIEKNKLKNKNSETAMNKTYLFFLTLCYTAQELLNKRIL